MDVIDIKFTDLVNLDEWQKIQDSCAEAFGVTIRTFSPDFQSLTKISHPVSLCSGVISGTYCACKLKEARENLPTGGRIDINLKCFADLECFVIPISAVANNIVAYVVTGPVILTARKSVTEYAKDAAKMGLTVEKLMDALIEINVFSYNKVYSMTNHIRNTFSYMAQTGYHKKRLGEIAPEVVQMDPAFARYYEEKILNALLRSCALALNIDSGSVMTIDKATNMLHIKAAKKLDKGIVKNTNIPVGQGIAGLAAKTAKPIILPKDKNKNGISRKMKRSDIISSVIMPFSKGNTHEVYGVINLNIVRKDRDFSQNDISIVKELVRMASISLIPLKTPIPVTTSGE